jgi:deoxyribonuclease V
LTIGPSSIDAVSMRLQTLHSWDLTPTEAIALQTQLAPLVIRTGDPGDVRLVAAADIAFPERTRGWQGGLARAAVVLMSYPGLALIAQHVVEVPVAFPYVPGLLSFREIPALARAFERLAAVPDLLLVDGQGVAHPRRFGLAAHLGLLAGIPTIGCAKSRLCGEAADPGPEQGSVSDLIDGGERVGLVVRTKIRVKPLYVSVGHLISLESAAEWVLRLALTHRLPEPIRLADRLSKSLPIAGSASPLV